MLHHALRAAENSTPQPLSFTYQSGLLAQSTTSTIVVPSGASVGDLAILIDSPLGQFGTIPTSVTPSGWTLVYSFSGQANSTVRVNFSYKVLVSGDLGASITGMTGATASRKSIMIFRPNNAIATMSGGGGVGEITNGDPTSKTIATGAQSPPAIAIAIAYASAAPIITSTTMTSVATDSTQRVLFYSIMNTSTSNQTLDIGDAGSNNIAAGCYFKAT